MRRIVIVGGGYAGLHAFAAINRRIGALIKKGEVSLTLVARDPYHTYHGWTGEVLAGRLSVGSTLTKLPTLLGGRYLEGDVTSISLDERMVVVRTPDGVKRDLQFDHLLVATGSRDPFDRIPGLADHGWCLKNTRDMQRLVSHLDTFTGKRIAVIGGGMAGAETASALCHRFQRLGRDVRVELITSGELLFRQLHPRFSGLAAQGTSILEHQGVVVRRASRVSSITEYGPLLENGDLVPADLTIVAAGVEFVPTTGLESLVSTPAGRYVADRFLNATGRVDVWLAGDIAEVAMPGGNRPCPIDALWAMKQGDLAGANIARATVGAQPERFGFGGLGQAAGLGNRNGISELYGLTFRGLLAWLIRISFFAWYMPRRSDGIAILRSLMQSWFRDSLDATLGRHPVPRRSRKVLPAASDRPSAR